MWRAVASLERIPVAHKLKLGDELMRRMDTRKGREDATLVWALGRIGARVPLYGPHNTVVPASKAAAWLETLMAWDWPEPDKIGFSLAQIGRRTNDRSRDLDETLRARLAAYEQLRRRSAAAATVLARDAKVAACIARESARTRGAM